MGIERSKKAVSSNTSLVALIWQVQM